MNENFSCEERIAGEDLEKNGFAKKAVTASKFVRSHRQKYTLIIIIHIILEFTIVFHRIPVND